MLQIDTYYFYHNLHGACLFLSFRSSSIPRPEIDYLLFVVFAGKPSRCKDRQNELIKIRKKYRKIERSASSRRSWNA